MEFIYQNPNFSRQISDRAMEIKSGFGGTKRKYHDLPLTPAPMSSFSKINYAHRRITKLAKQVKAHNPSHVSIFTASTTFANVSTTGTVLDLASNIAQGDGFSDRFSTQCILKRLNLKFGIIAGTTSTTVSNVRVTVIRAESGLVFASNMSSSYNPIVAGTSTKLLYDKYVQVGATPATMGFPCVFNKTLKLGKHKQKFTAVGAGTQTGESIYLIIQSDKSVGTTAPVPIGTIEVYFDPT